MKRVGIDPHRGQIALKKSSAERCLSPNGEVLAFVDDFAQRADHTKYGVQSGCLDRRIDDIFGKPQTVFSLTQLHSYSFAN